MLRGYVRVPAGAGEPGGRADPAEQTARLREAGVAAVDIRVDRSQGTRGARPELEALLADLAPGDVVVVTGLERLASSVVHMVQIGRRLRAAGADLRALDEGLDTRTGEGPGILEALDVLDGLQRSLVSTSTRAGLEAARSRGRRGGRPPRLGPGDAAEAQRLYDDGRSVTEIAEKLGVPRTTVYGHLRRPS